MNIFVLEDIQERINFFEKRYPFATICRTVKEAKEQIHGKRWDILFLDHDLGDNNEGDGYDFAKFLKENVDIDNMSIIIHSFNPVGAKNMQAVLGKGLISPFTEFFKGVFHGIG